MYLYRMLNRESYRGLKNFFAFYLLFPTFPTSFPLLHFLFTVIFGDGSLHHCLSNISYLRLVIVFVYKRGLLINTVRTLTLFGVRDSKFEVRTPTHSELQSELRPYSELACDCLRTSARGRIIPYSEYRNRSKQTE